MNVRHLFLPQCPYDEAAAFVVAADVPIVWERWFTRKELDSDPETSWMPEGTWTIDPARQARE